MKQQNWETALIAYINAEKGKPFEWGVRDCVTFAIGAIEAMLGHPVDKPEFNYTTDRGAFRFAKKHRLADGMRAQLAAVPVSPQRHAVGDIAIVKKDGFECCHVVMGKRCYGPQPGGTVQAFDTWSLYQFPDLEILRFQ